MALEKILILVLVSSVLNSATALPDSAGIVEMPNGLAYGGIPYGSVSGMVAKYGKTEARNFPGYTSNNAQINPPVVYTHNTRSSAIHVPRAGAVAPVQIFNHPGVVAPGVVGMIHQVGY